MTTSVTRSCFTKPHQNCMQDQDQDRFFWSQTGLVLRPMTVSDHITGFCSMYQSPLVAIVEATDNHLFNIILCNKKHALNSVLPNL